MKTLFNSTLLIVIFLVSSLLSSQPTFGQVIFTSIADTTAIVSRQYYYRAEAMCIPDDETYELLEAPDNMSVNSLTGEIIWIPESINDGGKVIVKATNSENESAIQEFFVYVASDIEYPSGIVAYWYLEETLSEVNDSVFKDYYDGNNARVTGTKPVDTAGVIGFAQKFLPGNSSDIVVPDNAVFDWSSNDDFSIEFWFKMNAGDLDSTGVIIGRNQGGGINDPHWWIGTDASNSLLFTIRTEDLATAEAVISGFSMDFNWHHVVAVRDHTAGEITLYVDGGSKVNTASYDGSGPGLVTNAPLCIGWLKPGSGDESRKYPYNGKLDELIIHNKALSALEIAARYNAIKNFPGNYAPLFITEPDTVVDEDSPYIYQYLAHDMEGDPLEYEVEIPAWLGHDAGTRTISGIPSDNDVGIFPVRIKVNDGAPDTVLQRFNITVNNMNDMPVLSNIETTPLAYHEGDGKVAVTSALVATDVDDTNFDSARVWISTNYTSGEDLLAFTNTAEITGVWNASAGVLKLSGSASKENYQSALRSVIYENTDTANPVVLTRTVSLMISDGELNSTSVTRNITVSAVNDCPVISDHVSLTKPEDDTILIRPEHLVFTDVDDEPGSFSVSVASGINYSYTGSIVTPAKDFNGTISVNVRLSDSECIVDYSLPVTVTPVNDPPEFNLKAMHEDAYENQSYLSAIRAIDNDPEDTIIFSVIQKPDWLNHIQDTILTGVPEFKDVGENQVIIRISDTIAEVDTTFIITVHSTNYIPRITSVPPVTVNEDELYKYNIVVTDTNSKDVIMLSAPELPEWLSLNTSQNTLEGTPTNEQLGMEASVDFPVKLNVSDGKQDSTQTFSITVHNINDAPEIKGQADTIITYPDSSITIVLADLIVEDVDNLVSDLKLIVLSGNNYALNENSITIISDQTGLLPINVRVEDPGKLRDQDTLYVRIAIPSSVDDPLMNDNLPVRIYPIPADDAVYFEILVPGEYQLELINMTGRTVLQKEISSTGETTKIGLSSFSGGIYLYRIYNHISDITGRIVIKK
jgi:hypothetical protein